LICPLADSMSAAIWRSRADRRRLAVLLRRGASIECAFGWRHSFPALVMKAYLSAFRPQIVFIEALGWIPATTWRMDQHFERFRERGPASQRHPSEYVKRAFLVHDASRSTSPDEAQAFADR